MECRISDVLILTASMSYFCQVTFDWCGYLYTVLWKLRPHLPTFSSQKCLA